MTDRHPPISDTILLGIVLWKAKVQLGIWKEGLHISLEDIQQFGRLHEKDGVSLVHHWHADSVDLTLTSIDESNRMAAKVIAEGGTATGEEIDERFEAGN